jgi:hypothetical protein
MTIWGLIGLFVAGYVAVRVGSAVIGAVLDKILGV